MNFRYTPQVLEFITTWEGNVLRAYKDAVGRWTIGVGIIDSKYAFEGNVITNEQSIELAFEHINRDIQACNRLVKVPTSPEQQVALLSFCYNFGTHQFSTSTLLRKLNAGDYMGAYAEFPRWNKGRVNGKLVVIRGLVNRRKAEADLFLQGTQVGLKKEEQPTSAQEPTSNVPNATYTSVVAEPPPNPKSGAGAATAGVATTAAVLQEASSGLEPLAPYSQYISTAFVILAVLALVWTLRARKAG